LHLGHHCPPVLLPAGKTDSICITTNGGTGADRHRTDYPQRHPSGVHGGHQVELRSWSARLLFIRKGVLFFFLAGGALNRLGAGGPPAATIGRTANIEVVNGTTRLSKFLAALDRSITAERELGRADGATGVWRSGSGTRLKGKGVHVIPAGESSFNGRRRRRVVENPAKRRDRSTKSKRLEQLSAPRHGPTDCHAELSASRRLGRERFACPAETSAGGRPVAIKP